MTHDITPSFLGADGIERTREAIASGKLPLVDVSNDMRFGPPLTRPPKVLCIGLNYTNHAVEAGKNILTEPVLFSKIAYTVVGAYDTVLIPRRSEKTDHEVELAVVIGTRARYLASEEVALDGVAGYAISNSNDVSERASQLERGGRWVKGKSCETSLGPGLSRRTRSTMRSPCTCDSGSTVNLDRQDDGRHGLRRGLSGVVPQPIYGPGASRRDQYRHPGGRRLGNASFDYLRVGDIVKLVFEGLEDSARSVEQA